MRFDEFTEEEKNYPGFELNYDELENSDFGFSLVKIDDKIYAVREEAEGSEYRDESGRIYILDNHWYMPFNIAQFLEDVELGNVTPDDFYIENYEL